MSVSHRPEASACAEKPASCTEKSIRDEATRLGGHGPTITNVDILHPEPPSVSGGDFSMPTGGELCMPDDSSALTSQLWRANSGSTRLSKRSSRFRARGRRSSIVPHDSASFRGLPRPLRYPGAGSTPARRSDLPRPRNAVSSSSSTACIVAWILVRTNSSRVSHVSIDGTGTAGVFFGTAASPSCRAFARVLGEPEGYVAFSLLHTS
jgi:hypothetical protein